MALSLARPSVFSAVCFWQPSIFACSRSNFFSNRLIAESSGDCDFAGSAGRAIIARLRAATPPSAQRLFLFMFVPSPSLQLDGADPKSSDAGTQNHQADAAVYRAKVNCRSAVAKLAMHFARTLRAFHGDGQFGIEVSVH